MTQHFVPYGFVGPSAADGASASVNKSVANHIF